MSTLQEIPARCGRAAFVNKGEAIRIVNSHGHQVVDTWAFNRADPGEFLSMEHMRASLSGIFPKLGEPLYSNRRRGLLVFEEDTSPGIHDTLIAACDTHRYRSLGCVDYHENCTDNLHAALAEIGVTVAETPAPLNLWMNIPVGADGACGWEPPVSRPGDYVVLRAEIDCIVVMSACPQDLIPVNAGNPVEAHFEILQGE